jgi:hypothetical protein
MKDVYCNCGGRIIPYMDMRDSKVHCEDCDKGYTIQEFWEILMKQAGGK